MLWYDVSSGYLIYSIVLAWLDPPWPSLIHIHYSARALPCQRFKKSAEILTITSGAFCIGGPLIEWQVMGSNACQQPHVWAQASSFIACLILMDMRQSKHIQQRVSNRLVKQQWKRGSTILWTCVLDWSQSFLSGLASNPMDGSLTAVCV
jgi:hypothetical protein